LHVIINATVLLQDEAKWQKRFCNLEYTSLLQCFDTQFSIHLGVVWTEMQSFLFIKTDSCIEPRQKHSCTLGTVGSRLDCYQLQWIH